VAAPRTLQLREHQRLERVPLTREEIAALADPRAKLATFARSDGLYDVKASEVVGTIVHRGLRVVIEPKLAIRRLLMLLGFATNAPTFTAPTQLDSAPDTLDAMTIVYADALEKALRNGPLSMYERQRDELHVPRGRIDFLDLAARKFGLFPPLTCDFDEFTPDNEINRRLLSAATTLLRAGLARGAGGRRLAALCSRLADVTETRAAQSHRAPLRLDQRFEPYKPALSLAEIILRHSSIELRDGVTDSIGMLVDMNDVYEDFIAEGLRETLGESADRWRRRPTVFLDEQRRVKLVPDVVWRAGQSDRLVLDVKYKADSRARNEDIYQMAAYCHALGLRRGVLVYASVREEMFRVRNDGPEIHVFSMDPDGERDQLLERLRRLAGLVSALAT